MAIPQPVPPAVDPHDDPVAAQARLTGILAEVSRLGLAD